MRITDLELILDKALLRLQSEKTRGVYFLTKELKIVYVGQSCDVHRRVAYHVGRRQNKSKFDECFYVPIVDYNECLALERKLIKELRPKYNYTHIHCTRGGVHRTAGSLH